MRQADECIQVLEVLRSQKSVPKLLVLAHLVPVAETPTVDAKVLAVSPIEIELQELPEF